jgi:hypothetical protein
MARLLRQWQVLRIQLLLYTMHASSGFGVGVNKLPEQLSLSSVASHPKWSLSTAIKNVQEELHDGNLAQMATQLDVPEPEAERCAHSTALAIVIPVTAAEVEMRMAHRQTWMAEARAFVDGGYQIEGKPLMLHLFFAIGDVALEPSVSARLQEEEAVHQDIMRLQNNETCDKAYMSLMEAVRRVRCVDFVMKMDLVRSCVNVSFNGYTV